jgi:3-hydroxyisobutyrate dehydrogenase-like beta-hydroxyacid dehydrogenase
MSDTTYGWLGTGRLGIELSARLLSHSGNLTVWNRTAEKARPLVEQGADQVQHLHELARCDVVFVCVLRSEDLLEVLVGENGILTHAHHPRIVVDCSTVSVDASAQARAAAEKRGVAFLAACVSGNPAMVREGGAAIVASGPRATFDEVEEQLRALAATAVHVGAGEESRVAKIAHNLLLGLVTQSLGEVTTLAEKAGIPAADFLAFINGSVLGSVVIEHKGRAMVERDYEPTFTSRHLRKDFDLGMAAAREHEVPMPLTASTHQLIQTAIGRGYGGADYVSLYEVQAEGAGLRDGAA